MTDQELVLAAAKAVGFIYDPNKVVDNTLIGRYKNDLDGSTYVWNPLEDISDAVDLAVYLGIKIKPMIGYVSVEYGALSIIEPYSAKNVPSVCRAVTRCAAEFSKHLP